MAQTEHRMLCNLPGDCTSLFQVKICTEFKIPCMSNVKNGLLACHVAGAAQTHAGPCPREHQYNGTDRQHLLLHSPADMLQASALGRAAPSTNHNDNMAVYAGTAINGTHGKAPDSGFGQPRTCCEHALCNTGQHMLLAFASSPSMHNGAHFCLLMALYCSLLLMWS